MFCAASASLFALSAVAQQPEILTVADVVAGSEKMQTRYLYAAGKWSDAGDSAAGLSAQIHCYQRFGFCEAASAFSMDGRGYLNFDTFDILRWDTTELIAVDSSPICLVNTLRIDFPSKKVSLSSASKGSKEKLCQGLVNETKDTVFMINAEEDIRRIFDKAKQKK